MATVTVSVNSETTFTASYSNVTDTCTVTVGPSYLFYDGGVTGNVNTDYTNLNGTINASVSSTGTNISCSTYADCYRRANALISGDFRVTVTCVSSTDNGFDLAFLNSSNSKQYSFGFSWNAGKDWNKNGSQLTSNLSAVNDSPITAERVNSTLTVKCNGTQLFTATITTSDVYFAFKTHSQGGRNCTIKDLMIEAL